ncbi:PREDICTED: uncharacterized protein LOC109243567 [Nicotiana attenuata]|uniref:uncharacterized protein LOC109243567 n=1 Tax=Nicotiana attenuata TaxID=49451 RepID=UPI0009057918|nr:PREDICTED: uncharacterized protein LOC109243567 [Nicotiana attenuata]
MAEDQTIPPTTEEKNLDFSSSSIPFSTPSDSNPPVSVENSDNPKNESISPLFPETYQEWSKDDIPVPEENSKSPSAEKASSLSPESDKGSKENSDQSTGTPISSVVAPMEPQERDAIENMLAIAAEGIIGKENSTMSESQGEETQSLVGEGAMVLFEWSSPEDTTGTPLDGPDPSPEERGQKSSSQVSFYPYSSPHFDAEPLEVVAPVMRSSDEENEDDVALSALIAARRLVATLEPPPKRPTKRLQKKEALESALKKSKRSNMKKKKRLVKDGEIVCDKNIPVVEVDEEAPEEPSSLIKRSQKKKHSTESTSKEVVGIPSEKSVKDSGKLKEVVVEESVSDEDMQLKSIGKVMSSGKSTKSKLENVK